MARNAIAIFASSESDADIFYATRFRAPNPFLYLEKGGRGTAYVSKMEYSRAKLEAKCAVRLMPPSAAQKKGGTKETGAIAALLKKNKIRSVVVPFDFPLGLARKLEGGGVRVSPKPSRPFFESRKIKTGWEIACIRRSQLFAQKGVALAREIIAQSKISQRRGGKLEHGGRTLTSEFVRENISKFLVANGFDPSVPIVSCGAQSAFPHQRGSGPLFAHRPIIVDVFPRDLRTGYWGDCTRTFAKGAPAEEIVSMHAAVAQAHKAATGKIRDGAWGERIHEEVKKTFSERGYFNNYGKRGSFGFTHGTGHGVGLEVHEEPRIASGAGPLFAGNVVTVEPGLYYQKTGGVRIEDLVAVRKNGCENLTSLEKGLAID